MQITENKSYSQVNEFLVLMMWEEILHKTLNSKAFHLKLFAKISLRRKLHVEIGPILGPAIEPSSMRT